MNKDFHNLDDAGEQLASLLVDQPTAIIALIGQGAEIAVKIAKKFGVEIIPAVIEREKESREVLSVDIQPCTKSGLMYIVDDAVETGHTTLKAWNALLKAGYRDAKIAVPVCPRDTASLLLPTVGEIVAVKRPMIRRSLGWHYEELPATSAQSALTLISQHNLSISN